MEERIASSRRWCEEVEDEVEEVESKVEAEMAAERIEEA
jgi:hypothetical protein